jgi:hypothetical protein
MIYLPISGTVVAGRGQGKKRLSIAASYLTAREPAQKSENISGINPFSFTQYT